jgi:hypothetical protein
VTPERADRIYDGLRGALIAAMHWGESKHIVIAVSPLMS